MNYPYLDFSKNIDELVEDVFLKENIIIDYETKDLMPFIIFDIKEKIIEDLRFSKIRKLSQKCSQTVII